MKYCAFMLGCLCVFVTTRGKMKAKRKGASKWALPSKRFKAIKS